LALCVDISAVLLLMLVRYSMARLGQPVIE
jgi:hypothetical protein